MREPNVSDNPLEFTVLLVQQVNRLEAALTALASEPGQPHHAAEQALKILNQES